MNLESIISITGKPGLYKVISQAKNGLIVEAIPDGKRMPVYSSEKVSSLTDISIYTNDGDIPLVEVYEKLYKKTEGKSAIDHKSDTDQLRKFLKEVIEDFDQDRVYNSDLKKLFQWFNILVAAKLLKPETKKSTKKEETKKAAPTKKATTKKPQAYKQASKTSGAKGGSKTATPSKKGK